MDFDDHRLENVEICLEVFRLSFKLGSAPMELTSGSPRGWSSGKEETVTHEKDLGRGSRGRQARLFVLQPTQF